MLRSITKWTVFSYAILLIILGLIGYTKGSLVSLILGCTFGVLLLISTLIMSMGKKFGSYSALFLTALLTGTFSYRYAAKGTPITALLAVVSGAMLIFLLFQLARWRK